MSSFEAGVVCDWCHVLSRLSFGHAMLFDKSRSVLTEQLVVHFDRDWPIIIREARVFLEVLEVDFRIAKCLRDEVFLLYFSMITVIPTDTLHPWRLVVLPVRNSALEQLYVTFMGLNVPCLKGHIISRAHQ